MIDEFEYEGVWFLPDKPDLRVAGTLQFHPDDGAVLRLVRSLSAMTEWNAVSSPDVILGECSAVGAVTLLQCVEVEKNLSQRHATSLMLRTTLRVSMVLLGEHFLTQDACRFRQMVVQYSDLDEWLDVGGPIVDLNPTTRQLTITYQKPEPITLSETSEARVFVEFRPTYPTLTLVQKEATVRQTAAIGVELKEEGTLAQYREVFYHIQNFLTLAVGRPTFPLRMTGRLASMHTGDHRKPEVEIVYQLIYQPTRNKPLATDRMLFTYLDAAHRIQMMLENWMTKSELLRPVYDLYFGTLYNPRQYPQQGFLSIIQALECYHRRVIKTFEMPKYKHRERIRAIRKAVPPEHRSWLNKKLMYSNELTLEMMLTQLITEFPNTAAPFDSGTASLAQTAAITRNYLTHFNERLREKAATGLELYELTDSLARLMQACLLKEMGLPTDEIGILVRRGTSVS